MACWSCRSAGTARFCPNTVLQPLGLVLNGRMNCHSGVLPAASPTHTAVCVCSLEVQPLSEFEGYQDDRFRDFTCGTQFIRQVSAPGTGKSTALRNLWGYVHDNFDGLVASLPVERNDSRVLQLRERVMRCLDDDHFLSFTFSNKGRPHLFPPQPTCLMLCGM